MVRTSLAVLAATVCLVALEGTAASAATSPPPPAHVDSCSWTQHNHYDTEHQFGCDHDAGYWYQHGSHHGGGGGGGGHR